MLFWRPFEAITSLFPVQGIRVSRLYVKINLAVFALVFAIALTGPSFNPVLFIGKFHFHSTITPIARGMEMIACFLFAGRCAVSPLLHGRQRRILHIVLCMGPLFLSMLFFLLFFFSSLPQRPNAPVHFSIPSSSIHFLIPALLVWGYFLECYGIQVWRKAAQRM